MNLSDLNKGIKASITGIDSNNEEIAAKLREIGFAEGDEVEVLGYGPFGLPPMCIRLNQTLIALRKAEASFIKVSVA